MSWLTEDWRLKLLALGLAVLMLGAVAFSQNPPTTRTLTVPLSYELAKDIVIINPPTKISVTFSGLADVISSVSTDNLTASADASLAAPGPAVTLRVTAHYTGTAGVAVQNPAPIVVDIDEFKTKQVPVEVITHPAGGWTVTKAAATCGTPPAACVVNFSGPASWENGLRAEVVYKQPVNFGSQQSPNWPIQFVYSNGQPIPTTPTEPQTTWDVSNVNLDIEGQQASSFSTVALVASSPAQQPAPRYEITGVIINPVTVVISGDPAVIGQVQRIVLPAIDLSAATTTVSVRVTIPYPDNVSGNAQTALVTYIIQPNPNVTPSP
jgi:YbbR domain-containing protein